jgi:hypothetical protein
MGSPARRLINPITRCWDHPSYGYAGTDDRQGTDLRLDTKRLTLMSGCLGLTQDMPKTHPEVGTMFRTASPQPRRQCWSMVGFVLLFTRSSLIASVTSATAHVTRGEELAQPQKQALYERQAPAGT